MSIMDQVLAVGDSITEGYADNGRVVSCRGFPGSMLFDSVTSGTFSINPINLGQSGFMVRNYLARAYGFISADRATSSPSITSCLVSSWTPNIPNGETTDYSTRSSTIADNKAALVEFESFCVSNAVLFMPVFLCASPYDMNATRGLELKAALDDQIATWPWLLNANTVIQNAAITTYPMASTYWCTDATHPSGNGGYDLLKDYINTNYAAARALAKTAYGIA